MADFVVRVIIWLEVNIIPSIASALFGAAFTSIFSIKAIKERKKLKSERIRMKWGEAERTAENLAKKIKDEGFIPDVIFIPDIRSGTVANMIERHLCDSWKVVPIIVGTLMEKGVAYDKNFSNTFRDFYLQPDEIYNDSSWHIHVPQTIIELKDKKILIIDDFYLKGGVCNVLKKFFIKEYKFDKENIKFACLVKNTNDVNWNYKCDYHGRETKSDVFLFPWRTAEYSN